MTYLDISEAEKQEFLQNSGVSKLSEELLQRFERLTGREPHRFLKRQISFAHRDFDRILDCYERHEPFVLFTGRGPSSASLHVGHAVPFELTK